MFKTFSGGFRASRSVLLAKSKTFPVCSKKISSSAPRCTDRKKVELPPDFRDSMSELDSFIYKEWYVINLIYSVISILILSIIISPFLKLGQEVRI